ncbi:MAG: hypothetical protein GY811_01220 [Myxococcales bacterium]|nr:hypothetical protein [Myxococcales bacterium]
MATPKMWARSRNLATLPGKHCFTRRVESGPQAWLEKLLSKGILWSMPEDVYVNVQYQGIELGNQLCMQEFTDSEAYLQCPQPMPVGSDVVVCVGGSLEIPVRVARVSEQVAGVEKPPGMLVKALELDEPARKWWAERVPAASSEQAAVKAAEPALQAAPAAEVAEEDRADTDVVEKVGSADIAAKEVEAAVKPKPAATKTKKRRRRKRK